MFYCNWCSFYNFCRLNDNFKPHFYKDILEKNSKEYYRNENYMYNNKKIEKVELEEQILSPTNFKLTYPFIMSLEDEDLKERINEAIIDEVLYLFKNQVMVAEKINFQEIIGFYKVTLNEKGLLSILFSLYTYTGGAHGYTAYSSLTIDLNTGEIYEFEDLFNPKFYYKGFLDKIIYEKIKEMDVPLIEEYNGITENQQFYLTPESLVIYYQVYEYTPYAYGLFKIEIPYTEIISALGPVSPIQRLI